MIIRNILVLFILLVFVVNAVAQDKDEDLEILFSWLPGMYSNASQVRHDTTTAPSDLYIRRIWDQRTDGAWFLVDRSVEAGQSERQKLLWMIHRVVEGMIEVLEYQPAATSSSDASWPDSLFADTLNPEKITLQRGCELYLQFTGEAFTGQIQGLACRNSNTSIAYIVMEIDIRSFGSSFWQRGYNAAGEQVYGRKKSPYYYERRIHEHIGDVPDDVPAHGIPGQPHKQDN